MFGRKRVLRVISVLTVALAAGHLVESLRASAVARNLDHDQISSLASQAGGSPVAPGPLLPRSASLSAGGGGDLPPLLGITTVSSAPDARANGDCAPLLTLAAGKDAMINLALDAPCNPGQRVVIRHAGLSFAAQTGGEGRLTLRLPALADEGMVAVYFESSEVVLATVQVPEATGLTRFVFQAPFPVQFDLRAEEAGRVYSGKGAQAAQDDRRKIESLGFASVSAPLLAQVYTFPGTDLTAADLTVELRITPETCGSSFQAETVLSQGGRAVRSSLPLAMPLCGTAGDILVLKNLVSPPTLAASN